MPDQTSKQCGKTHDHERHTWYDDPKMWCPGVIAQPLNDGFGEPKKFEDPEAQAAWDKHEENGWFEDRPMPDWAKPISQCMRETAHAQHDYKDPVDGVVYQCPGVKAHHNTQIGKGGPHDTPGVWDNSIYCYNRGPRIGEDLAYCKRAPNHEGLHMTAMSDGFGDQRW